MLFLRHPAWLWLKIHDRYKLPPDNEELMEIFQNGHTFEACVVKQFPNAVRIGFSFENNDYNSMPARTRKALAEKAEIILQGRLEGDGITCIFDLLKRVGENEYDLTEIKSTTKVKKEHEFDLAFQTIVLEDTGLKIRKMYVIFVNNQYIRKGEIDPKEISKSEEITDKVRTLIEETKGLIQKAKKLMISPIPPDFSPRYVGIESFKYWMPIFEYLYPQKEKYNIYKLCQLNSELVGELEDLKISCITDIPDSIKLKDKQKIQVKVTKEDRRIIDKKKIQRFLSTIVYPIYFFDYETFSPILPPFDGVKPNQKIPFQYSLHIIDAPDQEVRHKEFLHKTNTNPCPPLLEQLKRDIGGSGTVLVWHESFEKKRNEELGKMYPEYTQFMNDLNERIIDLKTPFSEDWFIDKNFFGSASIKKVLPALISSISYDSLAIKEGLTASRTWKEVVFEGKQKDRKDEILNQLIEYCKLDTLAMVQLYKFLKTEV